MIYLLNQVRFGVGLLTFLLRKTQVRSSSNPSSPATLPSRASSLPPSRPSSPLPKAKGKGKEKPKAVPTSVSISATTADVATTPESDGEGESEVGAEEIDEEEEMELLSKNKTASTKRSGSPVPAL